MSPGSPDICVLCPTRWTVKTDAMLTTLRCAVEIANDCDIIARIAGVAQMKLFHFILVW